MWCSSRLYHALFLAKYPVRDAPWLNDLFGFVASWRRLELDFGFVLHADDVWPRMSKYVGISNMDCGINQIIRQKQSIGSLELSSSIEWCCCCPQNIICCFYSCQSLSYLLQIFTEIYGHYYANAVYQISQSLLSHTHITCRHCISEPSSSRSTLSLSCQSGALARYHRVDARSDCTTSIFCSQPEGPKESHFGFQFIQLRLVNELYVHAYWWSPTLPGLKEHLWSQTKVMSDDGELSMYR